MPEQFGRDLNKTADGVWSQTVRQTDRQTDRQTEHFKVLIGSEELGECLYDVCSAIAILPESVRRLLSASRLVALRKSNNEVRPIAIGESLRRLTARAICLQMKDTFADFFSPVQHGVSTECGTELLSHHVQLLLEANPDWVVLKTDVKNPFYSLDRCQLLKEVSLSFPDLFYHVQQMYLNINSLVFLQKEKPVILINISARCPSRRPSWSSSILDSNSSIPYGHLEGKSWDSSLGLP